MARRLLSAAVVVTLIGAGCDRVEGSKPTVVSDARVDFGSLPDGPAPSTFGPGLSLLTFDPPSDAAARLRVVGGKLTNDPTASGRVASYFTSANMVAPITTIGARWTFTARGGTPGAMALLVSQTAVHPPFSVHLVITPNMWSFGVWPADGSEPAGVQNLASQRFDVPLVQDGSTELTAEVEIEGERADIQLPDGTHHVVRDSRIAEWAGLYATFEAYADHNETDSRIGFTEIWAKSVRVS